jgi:glycosyltransferase involved in cell wall biosynthesis
MSRKRLWITWENQRRSVELARHFGCDLALLDYTGIMRYPRSLWKTCAILYKKKPGMLFVQNPSMFLATFACFYGKITSTFIIVDRHTTFLLTKKYRNTPRIILFKLLHRFTLKYADLTIVTNKFLADIVHSLGGRAFILPDKLPSLLATKNIPLQGEKNILLISSFGIDEPVEEVLAAMTSLENERITLYITGNCRKLGHAIRDKAPSNVVFTGFLSEQEFINYLFSVDVVMTLTTARYCLLCGCYEAIAAEKPLITSKMKELEDYFGGAFFVDNTKMDIAEGIKRVLSDLGQYQKQILGLKEKLNCSWAQQYDALEALLAKAIDQS